MPIGEGEKSSVFCYSVGAGHIKLTLSNGQWRCVMSTQVTLTLPDDLVKNAQDWSALTHRTVTETLTDALRSVLTPIEIDPKSEESISLLNDEEVLALAHVKMNERQAAELNRLLVIQREGTLSESEQRSLEALMQVYNQLLIRQSEALAEAVKRGIHPPLQY